MKKPHTGWMALILGMAVWMGSLSWAQETRAPFDLNQSQQELEIMGGILRTKVSFALGDPETKRIRSVSRNPNVDAFYLNGQGAVFLIPVSRFSGALDFPLSEIDISFSDLGQNEKIREFAKQIREYSEQWAQLATAKALENAEATRGDGEGITVPSRGQKTSREREATDRESLQKRSEEIQSMVAERRAKAEASRKKFLADLAIIKDSLVEALAGYADSLATVKPNEYVNIVLLDVPSGDSDASTRHRGREVISARKSWISDHKAGKLSLEEFKRKVLQYRQ